MIRERGAWLDEDDGLQVFVPGLMATGILVSIGMFIWDAVKKFLPQFGRRQRAAHLATLSSGRVSDLASVELGEAPSVGHVDRVRRSRGSALLHAIGAFAVALVIAMTTFGAYAARTGTLGGRGWTLSMGLSVAGVALVVGLVWLLTALADERLPAWAEKAQTRWPIGVLPEPAEDA